MIGSRVKKSRESNIELLRIIAMFLIVLHHYVLYGLGVQFGSGNIIINFSDNHSINTLIAQLLSIGGKIGVDIFIIVTGYFSVNSKFKLPKLFRLHSQIWTYSVGIYLILLVLGNIKLGAANFITNFFPVIFQQWWFLTIYFFLCILSPFINIMVGKLTKNQFQMLISILIIALSVIPTAANLIDGSAVIQGNIDISPTLFFILLYLIGGYIRLYKEEYRLRLIGFLLVACNLMLSYLSIYLIDLIGLKKGNAIYVNSATIYNLDHSIFLIGISIGLFLIFLTNVPFHSKLINFVSGSMLSVYMITEDLLMRPIIWTKLSKPIEHLNDSPIVFVKYTIATVFMVFFICIFIDIVFGKQLVKVVYFIQSKIINMVTKQSSNFLFDHQN